MSEGLPEQGWGILNREGTESSPSTESLGAGMRRGSWLRGFSVVASVVVVEALSCCSAEEGPWLS